MKISIISNLYPPHVLGGYELGCAEIAELLVRAGHEVEVSTSRVAGRLHRYPEPAGAARVRPIFAPVFEYEEQHALHASPEWRTRRARAFAGIIPDNVSALLEHWRTFQPDAVWAFNLAGLGTLGMLECLAYAGVPAMVHHMDFLDVLLTAYQAPPGRVARAKARLAAISCSEFARVQNEQMGRYGRHEVIPNGIHFPDVVPPAAAFKSSDHDVFQFICFGQITEQKGITELVEAFRHLLSIRPRRRMHLTIQGPCHVPSFMETLRGQIHAHNLQSAITVAEPVVKHELLASLPRYDAAVMLLNEHEAFGYAPLEASAAGLPVIFPRSAGVGSFLPTNDPLLLNERTNEQATAETMARCVDDPAWATVHARSQREALMAACDLEKTILPTYFEVLHSLKPTPGVSDLEATLLASARMMEDHQIWMSAAS
jgi:glycosyltransferase involved in cell wall biosynthesis